MHRRLLKGPPVQRAFVVVSTILAVGVAGCSALAFLGWTASNQILHPPSVSYARLDVRYSSLPRQQVTFRGAAGTVINARFIPGRSRATIVLSHGFGASQDQMLPWAYFLHQAGFSVLTYDMRGRGRSDGTSTLGVLEQQDLIGAVTYLTSRSDVDGSRVGALGFSLGGATTIMAAAQDPRIKAVVDDSGYADLHLWFKTSVTESVLHPTDPLSALSLKIVEWRTGIHADALRPMAVIGRISPRPVLIIQGTADRELPLVNSEDNYAGAEQPKQLWWVAGADHGETLNVGGLAYERRVVAFFRRALRI